MADAATTTIPSSDNPEQKQYGLAEHGMVDYYRSDRDLNFERRLELAGAIGKMSALVDLAIFQLVESKSPDRAVETLRHALQAGRV